MKARERIKIAFNHEEPDKVPSFELSIDNVKICHHFGEEFVFQGLVKSFAQTHDLCNQDPEETTKTILAATETRSYIKNTLKRHTDLYHKIGIDLAIVPLTGYILFPQRCEKDHFIDEYGRIFDLKKNPADQMDIAYYRDGAFESFKDYQASPSPEPGNPRRKKFVAGMQKLEKDFNGEIAIIPSMWGIFEATWQSFGFTNFSKLMAKPEQIKQVFEERGQFTLEVFEHFIEWGEKDFVLIYDDYGYKSGLLMRPIYYKKYVLPWLERICELGKKNGVDVIFHSCGDIYGIFDDIVKAGISAIHPIEPTTANPEYDIFKLHRKYGEKLTFMGNVSPQSLADKGPDFIKEYTKKLIKNLGPGGGYVLSSGHSINPAVKLENFLAMHEMLQKYGTYPINM